MATGSSPNKGGDVTTDQQQKATQDVPSAASAAKEGENKDTGGGAGTENASSSSPPKGGSIAEEEGLEQQGRARSDSHALALLDLASSSSFKAAPAAAPSSEAASASTAVPTVQFQNNRPSLSAGTGGAAAAAGAGSGSTGAAVPTGPPFRQLSDPTGVHYPNHYGTSASALSQYYAVQHAAADALQWAEWQRSAAAAGQYQQAVGGYPVQDQAADQREDEKMEANVPPSFDDIGPFKHVADYAAGMALRDLVLAPVLAELGRSQDTTANNEVEVAKIIDDYITGKCILLGKSTDGKERSIVAKIVRVSYKDAPTLGSWYSKGGDKVLSYTSRAWSDWWVRRCGNTDQGCEMIKLVAMGENDDDDEEEEEEVLGVAYFERSILDRHQVFVADEEEDKDKADKEADGDVTMNDASEADDGGGGKKRKRPEDDDKLSTADQKRHIRTTLLRGIRINPKYNPEVARRSQSSSNKKGTTVVVADTTPQDSYKGIPAALASYVLSQSLRYGTEALGTNCIKDDGAEAFYSSLLGDGNDADEVGQDDDGRKYYRLHGDGRWIVLRAAVVRQICLGIQDMSALV